MCNDGHGIGAGEVDDKVEEVTTLAEEPASSRRWIIEPVISGERPCVHAHDDVRRTLCAIEVRAKRARKGRKPAVEADHQRRHVVTLDLHSQVLELALGETERFLDEDGLPGAERSKGQTAVKVVARGDDNAGDRLVHDQLLDRAGPTPKAELLGGGGRRESRRSCDTIEREPMTLRERDQLTAREVAGTDESHLGSRE